MMELYLIGSCHYPQMLSLYCEMVEWASVLMSVSEAGHLYSAYIHKVTIAWCVCMLVLIMPIIIIIIIKQENDYSDVRQL